MSNHQPKTLAEAKRIIAELRGQHNYESTLGASVPSSREDSNLASASGNLLQPVAKNFKPGQRILTSEDVTESLLANVRKGLQEAPNGEARLTVLSEAETLAMAEIKRL
jgi:hypothetical protein